MTEHIERFKIHLGSQYKYILGFFILFTVMSYALQSAGKLYYRYIDKTVYYDITNPITVERKQNVVCTYVDAYIHRKVLVPIQAVSVKQLVLMRVDGKKESRGSYTTSFQADVGETTNVAHWILPCDIPLGTYMFEGIASYRINDVPKTTHFYTENFEIIATPSAELLVQ
jgi:hypothetical protein